MEAPVDRDYDLFEKLFENALARLKELASLSPIEHFSIHTPRNAIVGRVNAPKSTVPES
jgi:hypothetical protein